MAVAVAVQVQPGARRTEVVGLHGGALKVRVAAPPEGGRATAACLAALAAHFGVPVRQVVLLQGAASRRKLVQVTGGDPAVLARCAPAVQPAEGRPAVATRAMVARRATAR